MRITIVLSFSAGLVVGAGAMMLARMAPIGQVSIPVTGILEGWTVVHDDETLVCESPAVFAVARQIECP